MHVAGPASYPITAILPPPSHDSFFKTPGNDSGQSHTQKTFSGPALTVMPFNVEGLSAAKQQLVADLSSKHQCAVIWMQETHRGPNDIRPNVRTWNGLSPERPHSQYGSAIFVTSGAIVNATSITEVNNIYPESRSAWNLSDVGLQTARWTFLVPPATNCGRRPTADFNSHSSTWGYATTNTDGELVEDWV